MDKSGRERLWRAFEETWPSVRVKEEPLQIEEQSELCDVPLARERVCQATEQIKDADLFFTELLKVEAIISPKHIQTTYIPVDIPYSEAPKNKRRRVPVGAQSCSKKIGKIKMRRLADLQRPEARAPPVAPQPVYPSIHHRRRPYDSYSAQIHCRCPQCWTGSGRDPPSFMYPRPQIPQNFWRPFI